MIKEIQYTSIKRVLDNLMDHPLLRDVTVEQAVRYVIRFIGLHGYPKLYEDKIVKIPIHEFRGVLPCDLISIIQVRDMETGTCMRSMTDTFPKGLMERHPHKPKERKDLLNNVMPKHFKGDKIDKAYIPPAKRFVEEPAFKTQGRVIFTNYPEGCVEISYKSIPCDEDGFPLLIDNENYLAALEAFIKMQVFTVKFDTGKINGNVLQNAQQEYAFRAAELAEEFQQPSYSEMESLSRLMNTLIVPMRHFDHGFKDLGNREYLRKH